MAGRWQPAPWRTWLDDRCGRCHEMAEQPFTLVAKTAGALHPETGVAQAAAHCTGSGVGAEGGAGTRQPGQLPVEPVVPHAGVALRGKAVEEPAIDGEALSGAELRQHRLGVAEQQIEGHRAGAGMQFEAVDAGDGGRIGREQRLAQCGERRMAGQCAGQIVRVQWMGLDRQIVQPGRCRRQPLPELPGEQKVAAGAEAGLTECEAVTAAQS